ncbi:MAG TPA: glycosyltransferase family 39 protein [Phycisphaerae bacterium]|nr:glycosyltransferase family 39 protein [Phycisphaerae bacterium]
MNERSPRLDALAFGLIALAVGFMALPGISAGGLGWSDAPNHAFDGIFVFEFIKTWPLSHAREWAEQFYLRYPALGIFVYYPPGFAIVEAINFALFGVSILSARLTVAGFALGAGWLMFVLGRRWFDRSTGLLAALLLITCPHGFLWMNDVMLEWPATFWILAAVYCYERDRSSSHARWSFGLAAAFVAAFMTKQTAGFIFPVIIVHALIDQRDYFRRTMRCIALGLAILIIAAYLFAVRGMTALPSQLLTPSFNLSELLNWPPEIIGWPLLPLVALGLLTFLLRTIRGPRGLLLTWLITWTAFSLIIRAKEPRYLFFSLPPLMFAAVRFMLDHPLTWRGDRPRLLLIAAVITIQAAIARSSFTGHLPRYDAAVAILAASPDANVVLVDSVRDGQFTFDIYQNTAARKKLIPLRASKLLYARASRERYGYQQFVQSETDIVTLLDKYGIRYIVLESALPATNYIEADPPPRQMLRHLMATDPRFKLLDSWPLRCGDPAWDKVEVRLYAYPSCPPRNSKTITFSMPSMGRDVTLTIP